jgi:hypothetical protein
LNQKLERQLEMKIAQIKKRTPEVKQKAKARGTTDMARVACKNKTAQAEGHVAPERRDTEAKTKRTPKHGQKLRAPLPRHSKRQAT